MATLYLSNESTDTIFTPNLFYIRLYGAMNTTVGLEPSIFLNFIMSLIDMTNLWISFIL